MACFVISREQLCLVSQCFWHLSARSLVAYPKLHTWHTKIILLLHFSCLTTTNYPLTIFFNFKDFLRNNKELLTTLTELKAIAPPAIMGLNNQPVNGYNTPAAIGIPKTL